MAEPFGIAAGAIGIATAFTACIDCFEYIQIGRHFGRDFQTDLLSLSCARLRLTRWGESVNIYSDPELGKPDATAPEIKFVKDTLGNVRKESTQHVNIHFYTKHARLLGPYEIN